MKLILHDWSDEECAAILRNLCRRASPSGRVFIVEHIVPPPNTPHVADFFDLHMMCWGTGRERTADQYAALLESTGWRLAGCWYPAQGPMGVIEGQKL